MTKPTTRPWQPMKRGFNTTSPEKRAKMRATLVAEGLPADRVEQIMVESESDEMWLNNLYVVSVRRGPSGNITSLSIRTVDRAPRHDWREFQRIKNDICGPEVEAVEIYPAESRLVDQANQFWLWVFPPGQILPIGFEERRVSDSDQADKVGAVQRPLSA